MHVYAGRGGWGGGCRGLVGKGRARQVCPHLHALVAALGEELRPRPGGAVVLAILSGQQALAQRGVCGAG